MKKIEELKGVTLIALIVTIIILLILAGITISTLGGENGLFTKTKQAQKIHIKSEMKENLILVINELQIGKEGNATLDDVTQEYMEDKLTQYEVTVTTNASVDGKIVKLKKDGVIGKFLIDEKLNIVETEYNESSIEFIYDTISKEGDNVNILINVIDETYGIKQIESPDGSILQCNKKNKVGIDYKVKLGEEYKFKITSQSGEEIEKTILITDYWYKITKNISEGIKVDNPAIKVAYNKPYQATITAEGDYIIDTLTIMMGEKEVTIDKTTGVINIDKVTDDIEITATAKKLEIETTTPIINTSTTATNSLNANTQTKGTTLYINFKATLEGINCTVSPEIPYAVTKNGTYKFTVTGTYQGKTITKEIEVKVNQYQSAPNLVQYDAGDWTKEEIEELQSKKLYDINSSHIGNATFKLEKDSGLNFTFGGFTYKGDTANQSVINTGAVITSRNQSVNPQSGYGTPKYDGWQILESKEENGKIYVIKIVHAGSPENFVYWHKEVYYDAFRAEYLLSNGIRQIDYSKLGNNKTQINSRNWDMYKDKKQLDLIDDIHCMSYEETKNANSNIITIGATYWLSSAESHNTLWCGNKAGGYDICIGVRPVVSLKSGVYIASGDGTEASPYILAME